MTVPAPTTEVLADVAAIEALAPEWRALSTRSPSAMLFNDVDWLLALWRTLQPSGLLGPQPAPCVVAVREAGRLVGVGPFRTEIRCVPGATVRVARWWGEGPSDYGDLLVEREELGLVEAVLRPLLAGAAGCALLDLRECRGDSPVLPLMHAVLRQHAVRRVDDLDSVCRIVLPARDWTAYTMAQFTSKRRRDFQREWRRLQADGRFHWALLRELPAPMEWADDCGAVQASHRAAGEDRPGEFNHPAFGRFLRALLPQATAAGWLRAVELRREGELVAYFLAFAYRQRYYIYNTAHRADVQALGGGKLTMLYMLEQLIGEGVGPIDFLRGAEAYKEVLSDHVVSNRRLQASAPGWRAAWAARWWLDWVPHSARIGGRRARLTERLATVGLAGTWADAWQRLAARRRGWWA